MFGPDIASIWQNKWLCVVMGVLVNDYEWLLEQIQIWGAKIYQIDAAEHDHNMTYIQALRPFFHFCEWSASFQTTRKFKQFIGAIFSIYRLELAMIGRLFAQDAALYADIIMDKPENLDVIESLKQTYEEALQFFEKRRSPRVY